MAETGQLFSACIDFFTIMGVSGWHITTAVVHGSFNLKIVGAAFEQVVHAIQ